MTDFSLILETLLVEKNCPQLLTKKQDEFELHAVFSMENELAVKGFVLPAFHHFHLYYSYSHAFPMVDIDLVYSDVYPHELFLKHLQLVFQMMNVDVDEDDGVFVVDHEMKLQKEKKKKGMMTKLIVFQLQRDIFQWKRDVFQTKTDVFQMNALRIYYVIFALVFVEEDKKKILILNLI